MITKAWANKPPISCWKSSPSSPNSRPNEKPDTFTFPTEISLKLSLSATSILGCSINAPPSKPYSSINLLLSTVTIAKPAVAVVVSSS